MENLYKYVNNRYITTTYKDTVVVKTKVKSDDILDMYEVTPIYVHPQWEQLSIDESEEVYLKNYGNKLCSTNHYREMIVVEKNEEKVSVKLFTYQRYRRVGTSYFRLSTSVHFLTYNFKTNSLYDGFLNNYHKKRKCQKRVRRTPLWVNPISDLKQKILSIFPYLGVMSEAQIEERSRTVGNIVDSFLNSIPGMENYPSSIYNDIGLVKMICDKRGVKLPDNWKNLISYYPQPKYKHLKKSKMKYIDALMLLNGFQGDKIRKILHKVQSFNPANFHTTCSFFGRDFILSQSEQDLIKIFEYGTALNYARDCEKFSGTKSELKKIYNVLMLLLDGVINHNTFFDHIYFYNRLKTLEPVKWSSSDYKSFVNEHLEWTELLDFFTKGDYKRIYDTRFSDMLETPILMNGEHYHPVLLKTSKQYNEESFTQSNCVKGYINRAGSLIVSLRKNSKDSNERATIEFLISKNKDIIQYSRIQTLGRFNRTLSDEWNDVIERLDLRMDNLSQSITNLEVPKVIVKCGYKTFEASGVFNNKDKFNPYRITMKGGVVMEWDKDLDNISPNANIHNVPMFAQNINELVDDIPDEHEPLDLLPGDFDLI